MTPFSSPFSTEDASLGRTDQERHVAQRSGEELGRLLQGRMIELLEPVRWDRCGRLLADARLPGVVPSVCAWLDQRPPLPPADRYNSS